MPPCCSPLVCVPPRLLTACLPCHAPPCHSESVTLSKRLLIEGEGALGEAIIDQRTNVPMFRITR